MSLHGVPLVVALFLTREINRLLLQMGICKSTAFGQMLHLLRKGGIVRGRITQISLHLYSGLLNAHRSHASNCATGVNCCGIIIALGVAIITRTCLLVREVARNLLIRFPTSHGSGTAERIVLLATGIPVWHPTVRMVLHRNNIVGVNIGTVVIISSLSRYMVEWIEIRLRAFGIYENENSDREMTYHCGRKSNLIRMNSAAKMAKKKHTRVNHMTSILC